MEKVFTNVIETLWLIAGGRGDHCHSKGRGVFRGEYRRPHCEEDLERIFTPFYRVDKSRNRNSGGSGLGLYITKTILDHHEIIHNIVNTENGVKFTAFLW